MKTGVRVYSSMLVYVGKDRDGYYFTMKMDGSGKRFRLRQRNGTWWYRLSPEYKERAIVFTDPPAVTPTKAPQS